MFLSFGFKIYESGEEILGVLFFIFWMLMIIFFIKYVFIVLCVSDNGEGVIVVF